MKRRTFIAAFGGAIAWPLVVHAQQHPTMPVVGFLNSASAKNYGSMAVAFKEGLAEAGYVDGRNVIIEYRWAEDRNEGLPALAADLVTRRVAVIFGNAPTIEQAKAATATIPIVFLAGDDPVRLGFVASFNRPGGNLTGVSILSFELAAKRLELLLNFVPQARLIAVLINSDFGPSGRFRADIESAGRALKLPVQFLPANNEPEIDAAFKMLAQARADALLVGPGPFLDSRREQLVALAAKNAIPAAYETRATALAGGLMSYGASVQEGYRQAGIYAGRILKGERPADLPVLQLSKYELVVNQRTAKALGITVPPALLIGADEVIE
ncbi:MAG TPA: ABC transporter substrate-binding protein [Bradyrhizobium sp.]|nr:ABC transporter substrate-binding protein [Bradyrhizobium sp.]